MIPSQTPVVADEVLDEEIPTEETLESAILLDDALEIVTLLDDALEGAMLDEVVESHAPKSVHALPAAQPTPGS